MTKRLLLLGAGPAHRQALAAFAREPVAAAELLLVAPQAHAVLPALLPDVVAGRRPAAQAQVALAPLAAAAGAAFVEAQVLRWDAAARQVELVGGAVADYDLLSLDWPPGMDRDSLPGAREHALFLHPLEPFVRLHGELLDLAARRALDIVVLGGGDDAVMLALALARALDGRARIALVTGSAQLPLAQAGEAAQRRGAQALARRRITVLREAATRIDARAVHLANGARLACDAAIVAEPALPPPWVLASGLALDAQGHVALRPTLQSASHAEVFAPADARAGKGLARNLRRHAGGGLLQPWRAPPAWLAWWQARAA